MSEVTLYLGDCLEYMKSMPDKSVETAFADPPYNVGKKYLSYDDNRDKSEYIQWCKKWYCELKRITKSAIVITPGITNIPEWMSQIERTHYIVAWTKQNNNSWNYIGRKSGFQTWEPILIYGKAKNTWIRDSIELPISLQRNVDGHPCPKPLKLLNWLMPFITDEGDTIIDPFMGSGTTGVSALELKRNFIGCEIDPTYFAIAEKRIKQAAAQMLLPLEMK